MKNSIKCKSCSAENPSYEYICGNCGSYIRERVYNIDLWQTIARLIDSPAEAFRKIVYAEHKNFIFFIIIILAAKFLIDVRFIAVVSIGEFNPGTAVVVSYIIVLTVSIIYLALYSYIFKVVHSEFGIDTRFRDNFTLIIYALLPNVFALVLLFPLEMEVFGKYLFSSNPSPFVIKSTIAYTFLAAEILIKLWSIVLIYKAFKTQTADALPAIADTIIFVFFFFLIHFYLSIIIFTI